MPSFDIVSEIDMVEVRNAVDNANRELSTRYDFRGVEASFEFKDDAVVLSAEGDFQLQQMRDMLRGAIVKRKLPANAMSSGDDIRSGKNHKQTITFKQGIDQPTGKKIVKMVKDAKIKVQVSIQGDQLRVNGKKRDDLQAVMALVREAELDQSFQFNNFRD